MFIKELYFIKEVSAENKLKKREEPCNEDSELVQLLRQQNASSLEENESWNEIISQIIFIIRSQKKYIKQLRKSLQPKVMKNWEVKWIAKTVMKHCI